MNNDDDDEVENLSGVISESDKKPHTNPSHGTYCNYICIIFHFLALISTTIIDQRRASASEAVMRRGSVFKPPLQIKNKPKSGHFSGPSVFAKQKTLEKIVLEGKIELDIEEDFHPVFPPLFTVRSPIMLGIEETEIDSKMNE